MRSQSPQEMLSIAIPMFMAVIVFVILMGSFFQLQVSVGETYVPYKVASMVAHSLTGSTECLAKATPLPHKGWIDMQKVEQFASGYPNSMPPCVKMPCWVFRADVKDLETDAEYVFGYTPTDEEYWSDPDVNVRTNSIPIMLDNETWRHFGKITIEVRTTNTTQCNADVVAIIQSIGGVAS